MIAFLSKNLSCLILNRTPHLSRSPFSSSRSLNLFSTLPKSQLGSNPSVFDMLVDKHQFPPELASRVASESCYIENSEGVDSVVSFLKENGFSNTQLMTIASHRPRLLAASVEDRIKPKIMILHDLGISCHVIAKIISTNPLILELSVETNIVPSLCVLKGWLGSNDEVAKVLSRCPWFLTANFENTVVRNVEFLKSCGVAMEQLRILLCYWPGCLLAKLEIMTKRVEKAREMGLDASSRNFVYAISTISRMSNKAWELKMQGFRDLGFSDSDIVTMFRKEPLVFGGSMEKIRKITELLLATGKYNLSCIVNFPNSLQFSVEKRYIPRLRVLAILESRNLIESWPTLATVSFLSDVAFFRKFISPYKCEVRDISLTKSSTRVRKGR